MTDGVLNQLILQAVHSSKAYAKLQSDTARHTRDIQGQVGTGTGQNQAMAAVTVHLGPGESFEGIYKAAKECVVASIDFVGEFGDRQIHDSGSH